MTATPTSVVAIVRVIDGVTWFRSALFLTPADLNLLGRECAEQQKPVDIETARRRVRMAVIRQTMTQRRRTV